MINMDVESNELLSRHGRRPLMVDDQHLRLVGSSVLAGALLTCLVFLLILTLRSSSGAGVMPEADPAFRDTLAQGATAAMWAKLSSPSTVAEAYDAQKALTTPQAVATMQTIRRLLGADATHSQLLL